MRRVLVAIGVAGLFRALAPAASAATQIGNTFVPPVANCSSGITWLQAEDSVPADGVITRWDYVAAASGVPQLKFKVGRLVSRVTYSIVGESGVVSPTPGQANQFPVRIPVKAGDLIGFYTVTQGGCDQVNASFSELVNIGDVAPGTSADFSSDTFEMDVAASVESDADHDGFGDESQDKSRGVAGPEDGCPVAVTPTKKKCKKKKKKGKKGSAQSAKKKCKKKKRK